MIARPLEVILRRVKRRLDCPTAGDFTDRQLLERFASQRDEVAFASLVRRHGPLVLGVSRRILRHDQDAEDVFQATFLILARKAVSTNWQESIAAWLHCVAYRLALRSRTRIARQRMLEQQASAASAAKATTEDRPDLYTALDDELQCLSERYRAPLVLCYLEGKTRDQAARQLGWSLRTLERRLEQGLKLLRARLGKRGVELAGALLAIGLAQQSATASLTAGLAAATVEAAVLFSDGAALSGTSHSTRVVALAERGLKAMAMSKMRLAALVLMTAGLFAVGGSLLRHQPMATAQERQNPPAKEPAAQAQAPVWPEGATVTGRVVDHRGVPVAKAEVLLVGEERVMVEAEGRTWFVLNSDKSHANPPSTKTGTNGEFSISRKKGPADHLLVIAEDPLLWVVSRKSLAQGTNVTVKLPAPGKLAIGCNLPGKASKQPVMIQLQELAGGKWETDSLRFHFFSSAVKNFGETVFEHLPPGQYVVQRFLETQTGKKTVLSTPSDRQVVKVQSNQCSTIRFERAAGRLLVGQVRGLEKTDLRDANVTIMYAGPEERLDREGRRGRSYTAFDVIPITSDGRFKTDGIPPGQYTIHLFAVKTSTLEQSSGQSDFDGQRSFTVPPNGDMPSVELVAKPCTKKTQTPNTDYRVRVLDDAGKPLPKFEALLYTASDGYTGWIEGREGDVNLAGREMFKDAEALLVFARASGYSSSVVRFEGERRNELLQGKATITMRQGQKVELRFHLAEGLTWPKGVLPEIYFGDFEETVRTMRQPMNRQREQEVATDLNISKFRETGSGRFEIRLAVDTPPFHVAIHTPGFLQQFETGPFTLADVKEGVLTIDVPRPAGLDVRFDPKAADSGEVPFKGVALEVMRQIRGNEYLVVARDNSASIRHELKLADLAPGAYLVTALTQPNAESKQLPGTAVNPGSYYDRHKLELQAGKSGRVEFRYAPFDPKAFRGKRTAVLQIREPDGTPASDGELTVKYTSHYGSLTVFAGRLPESGRVMLENLTDQVPDFGSRQMAYSVSVGDRQLGHFGFTTEEPTQQFEFRLAPRAGDLAPDVELVRVATGKSIRLSDLRGKIVCLEFWATWCGPCQPAMAKLNGLTSELSAAWKDRLAIVPVSIDEELDRVQPHALRRGWTRLDHFWTGHGTDIGFNAPAARAFGVYGVPEAILIGRDGHIIWRGHPQATYGRQDFQSRIEAELKK